MTQKVRQGLGLLVAGVLAFAVGALLAVASGGLNPHETSVETVGYWALVVLAIALSWGGVLALLGGLVFVAWGLLRD